jgi:Gpi18-like mannosyltransferase
VIVSTVVFLIDHAVTWAIAAKWSHTKWFDFLLYWDSGWYQTIERHGYGGQNWAFFPFYPFLVKGIQWFLMNAKHEQWIGAALSTLLFLGFCLGQARLIAMREPSAAGDLAPSSRLGWLFFLYSPASWVFHSHHTESLFLVLSFGTFFSIARNQWVTAALFAGLSALTRIQGYFVIAGLLTAALGSPGTLRRRALRMDC